MLLRPATLRRLEKRLRPVVEEGSVLIRRQMVRSRDGAGHTNSSQDIGPVPARVSFSPYLRSREESVAGRPSANHRYLIELPAHTDIRSTDELVYSAPKWAPLRAVKIGEFIRPSSGQGLVFQSQSSGTTGLTEPSWTSTVGSTTQEGTVNWLGSSEQVVMQVIEIAQIDSYELVRDVYCDLRDNGSRKSDS